ncbi:MAG: hypothetical protein R6X10_17140 [Desulfobacterales bacterium]
MMKKNIIRLFVLIALAAGTLAASGGHLDRFIQKMGMASIADSNQRYLKDSFERATKGFIVLSAIKSGLAVIEGSEVGIGFSLEVGDIVQSIYDYVDIAWKTSLAGGTVLLLTRLSLDAAARIDAIFLSLMFFFMMTTLAVHWFFPHFRQTFRFFREGVLFSTVFTLTLYLVLPVSIKGAAYLSQQISEPMVQEIQEGFLSIQDEFSSDNLNRKLFPEKIAGKNSRQTTFGIPWNYKSVKAHFKSLQTYFNEKTEEIAVWTMKLIAAYLFDCILFPLTFFIILFLFTRGMVRYFLGVSRSFGLREDMDLIFLKHFQSKPSSADSNSPQEG